MGIREDTRYDVALRAVAEAFGGDEPKFREVIEALPAAVYTTDAEGRVTHFNRAAAEMAGREPEVGADWWCISWKLYWPDGRECAHDACPMAIALREQRPVRGREVVVERPDGTRKPVLPFPTPIFGEDGTMVGAVNLLVDLTELKDAETRVSASEERFRRMANVTPAMIWTAGPDGSLTWASDRWYEYSGVERELSSEGWPQHVHPEDLDRIRGAWQQAISNGTDFEVEVRGRRHDGEYRWFVTRAIPVKDESGTVLEWFGSTTDIHDQKRTQEELQWKKSELDIIARTTPVRLTRCSRDLRYLYANQATADLLGLPVDEIIGKPIVEILGEETFEQIRPFIEEVLSGRTVEYETELTYANSGARWVRVNYAPEWDSAGEVTGWVASIVDITQRKATEAALEEKLRQQRAIYKLSAAVAHTLDVSEIIKAALDALVVSVQADRASVLLFDDDGVMRFKGWRRLTKKYRDAVEGHSPWKRDDVDARPITVEDVLTDESLAPFRETITGEGIRALGFMPLVASDRVLGKFMVYYDQPHAFTEEEVQVCETIARHVSYGIERATAEEALRGSEERFRLATASGLVGVWDWDIGADTVTWSETTYLIHGLAPGEFGGTVEAFAQLVHPEDRPLVETSIRRSLEEEVPYEIEFRVVQPSGATVWLYTHAKVLRDEFGAPVRMLGGTLDITERKLAEEAMRASEQRSRSLSERLRVLLDTTSHLIETLETKDLLASILDLSRSIVEADAFGLWRRDDEHNWNLVASKGLSDSYLDQSLQGQGYADLPTEPIVVQPSDLAVQETSLLDSRWSCYEREGIKSLLVLPLRIHGEVGGTLVFYCRTPHEFSEIEVESARAMANIAAAAITTTELYEAQDKLRRAAESDAVRETFLADTTAILSESLEYEETLANVARAAVPKFADWCAVDLLEPSGGLKRIAVAHVDPAKVQLAHDLHEKYPPQNDHGMGVLQVIATGEPEMMSYIPDELIERAARDEEHLGLIRKLELRSYICVPLWVRDELRGAVTFVGAESGKLFEDKDMRVALEIARRSGQAIENAELYRDLLSKEERFRAVFQKSSVGKALVELDTQLVTQANASLAESLDVREVELLDRRFETLLHEGDLETFDGLFGQLRSGESRDFRDELRFMRRDGTVVWTIVSASVVSDDHGRPAFAIMVVNDITARKQAEEALVEHANTLATLNRTGATLAAETNLEKLIQVVVDAGTELSGAKFGAFFYNVTDVRGDSFLLYALSGASHEEFEGMGAPRSTALFAPTFAGDGIVRCEDVTQDPRFGSNAPHFGMPVGHLPVRSYMAVPVSSRSGEVIGAMFFGHPDPGVFTERTERVLGGVASQAAIAIDNAKLYGALSANERQMRLVTDSLPVLVSYVDREERYRFNSKTYETWFGSPRETLFGKTLSEVLGEKARAKLDPYLKRVFAGERVDFETALPYRSGPARQVSVTYVPDFDDEGTVKGFFAMVEDITERVEVLRAARRNDERLRQAYEAADMGTWRVDVETRTSTRDGNFNRMLGLEPVTSTQPMTELFALIHPEDRALVEEAWRKVFSENAAYDVEFRVLRKDGSARWLREVGRVTFDQEGVPESVAGVVLDNTDKRELELERQRASKLESIGVLAGGIAHDFNNILTAIMGNVSLANMYLDPDSEASERITAAERACQRAQKLTHQLLTFSKGGQPIKGTVSLPAVIEESANFVLQGSNVRLVYEIEPGVPNVEADAGQIGQAVQNLVLNAAQAMPEGGDVRINVRRTTLLQEREPLQPGVYVEVSVSDDGVGIPEENLMRIFDPFFTTKEKGSGLGLATTYSILQRHRGHIEVESVLGQGSTFRFYLPASEHSVSTASEAPLAAGRGTGRILVMDDEPSLCEIARIGLGDLGFEVETATGGSEAIRLFYEAQRAGRPFDAVVLDLTVRGDMGGRETLTRLLTLDPGVRAIVASGYSNDPVLARYRDYGFCGMIAKPFRMDDLARTIIDVLSD